MADEQHGTSVRLGPFHLGASHDDLGPGLGRLYEAWHTDTGAPVLLSAPVRPTLRSLPLTLGPVRA